MKLNSCRNYFKMAKNVTALRPQPLKWSLPQAFATSYRICWVWANLAKHTDKLTSLSAKDIKNYHAMIRPGLEPGISGSGGRRLIHWANGPFSNVFGLVFMLPLRNFPCIWTLAFASKSVSNANSFKYFMECFILANLHVLHNWFCENLPAKSRCTYELAGKDSTKTSRMCDGLPLQHVSG